MSSRASDPDLDCFGESGLVSSVYQRESDVFELVECRHIDVCRCFHSQGPHDLLLAGSSSEFLGVHRGQRWSLAIHNRTLIDQPHAVRRASPSR